MKNRFETFTVLISKIHRNIRKIKNLEMSEYNLRSTHISCLYYLYEASSMTATDLCEKCEEDKATISRSVEYLEKNGFLTCEAKLTKRYKSLLTLTEKGRLAGKKISEKINRVLAEISISLSEEQRLEFYRNLMVISEALETIGKRLNDPENV